MNTKNLRQQIRQQRRALSEAEREQASFLLCERIAAMPSFKKSQHIAFYLANDGEINLNLLIEHAWQQGKHCYLPVLSKPNTPKLQRLWFVPYTANTQLRNNRFAIPEPIHSPRSHFTKPMSLDLVLMPLVAFDPQGHRIGMGGGFYDKSFAFLNNRQYLFKPNLLGVAYELQKLKEIKTNDWDIPMQGVATEKAFYRP
ncbi:MAG: 5-formyltetrahydrofolate cyclo-ligase [Woeseiaceae bacterium]